MPRGVKKEIRDIIDGVYRGPDVPAPAGSSAPVDLSEKNFAKELKRLEAEMLEHARNLDFEKAAQVRDAIRRLREAAFGASAES